MEATMVKHDFDPSAGAGKHAYNFDFTPEQQKLVDKYNVYTAIEDLSPHDRLTKYLTDIYNVTLKHGIKRATMEEALAAIQGYYPPGFTVADIVYLQEDLATKYNMVDYQYEEYAFGKETEEALLEAGIDYDNGFYEAYYEYCKEQSREEMELE